MSSVPTNMAKNKSRDVTSKPAIMDDLPQEKLKTMLLRNFGGRKTEGIMVFLKNDPLQKACFLLFFQRSHKIIFSEQTRRRL